MSRLAREFRRSALPALTLPDPISEDVLSEAGVAARVASYEAFDLAHLGHYERSDDALPATVSVALTDVASECAGRSATLVAHRWYRLRRGDYSLARDDIAWTRARPPRTLDLTLDSSDAPTGEAEVVFTHRGQPFFTAPQRPGSVSLVERGPTTQRYDRYLTHRVGGAVVLRLRVMFTVVDEV